uniref:Uncharacterized protein n=1 Tax=Anguilla anguilla TaxID=7936 RepID=A0A0E9RLT3_ANGAN
MAGLLSHVLTDINFIIL